MRVAQLTKARGVPERDERLVEALGETDDVKMVERRPDDVWWELHLPGLLLDKRQAPTRQLARLWVARRIPQAQGHHIRGAPIVP